MQFSGETNNLDLYSDARYLCNLDETSDTTSYPIKAFTRNANLALDTIHAAILKVSGWTIPYDDSNQSGELLDVANSLVSGTQKTSLSLTWLKINRVRIKNASGSWITLRELPRKAQFDSQLTATAGTPSGYFIMGNYLYFDKAPSYSSSAGLEVQYQRGPSYFAYTDTTKAPGFPAQFHRLVSLYAAFDYCSINLPGRIADIAARIGSLPDLLNGQPGSGMLKELADFYSMRDADTQVGISTVHDDYGQLGLSPGSGPAPFNSYNPYGF